MQPSISPIAGSIVAILMCALLFGGCEPGQKKSGELAGRTNVDAMPGERANDSPRASSGVSLAPAKSVVSQTMPYTEYDDHLVYGYFSVPADMFEPLPGVIMIHEWWGLNDNIRATADRLASEGYIVFAIDLFSGKVAKSPGQARELMLSVIEDPEPAKRNIESAFKFVREIAGAPRVGSVGWGFGGGWSLQAAQLLPDELAASVIYYGQVTDDEDKLRPVNTAILGLFGAEDRVIRVASVEAFGIALERLRKKYEIHIYPGAGHAFVDPSGHNYDAASANDAWQRTLEFLQLHLATGET